MKFKKLTNKQELGLRLLWQDYAEILFDGGSRAGKTFLILLYCLIICGKYAGIRCLLARFVFAHAKSSIWLQTLLPLLQDNKLGLNYIINHSDHIIKFDNGSEIWLGGLDNKERADKILGQEYAFIFLNEAVSFPQKIRDIVKTRLAQKIEGFKNKIVYDCNPRSPYHYLFQEFYIQNDLTRAKLKWLPDDNLENIADNYIENVLDKLTGNEKKRFRFGEWANVEGSVYPEIKAENIIDTIKDFKYYDDIVGGIDFGLYTAIDLWGFKEKKAYNIMEIILIGSQNTMTSKMIKEMDKIKEIKFYDVLSYCDHEPDRIQELSEGGYLVKKAYKDVEPGDASVNDFELFFDINCKNTFQSMLNLTYQQDNNGQYIEKHVKENDHEADASRYAIHGYKMDNASSNSHFFGKGR